jgi:hypothetical protein
MDWSAEFAGEWAMSEAFFSLTASCPAKIPVQ